MSDDSPSVIGAHMAPMPTEEEYKAAFKRRYVELFVEVGVDEKDAVSWFEDKDWDDLKTGTPEQAFTDETENWDSE
jgi:hypothetical protein